MVDYMSPKEPEVPSTFDKAIDDAQKSVVKSVTADIYVEVKNWLTSLDPTGKKLAKYREGILRKCGTIQIMGMATPRRLEHVYIALRAIPNLKKHLRARFGRRFIDDEVLLREQIEEFLRNRDEGEIRKLVKESGLSEVYIDDAINFSELFPTPEDYIRHEDERAPRDNASKRIPQHGKNALRIIKKDKHVLVLGQPGSGKTTFLKYLALAYLGFVPVPLRVDPLLPIFVPLREYKRTGEIRPSAEWLLKFVLACASDMSSVRFSERWIDDQLSKGNCLVLLDGIDEIPVDLSKMLVQSISAFKAKYGENKIIATCRTASFSFGLEGFQLCEVDDFDDSDVEKFVSQWFDDQDEVKRFLAEVQSSDSSRDLCRTPLLLTLLCISYGYSRSIPKDRVELYESCVDALLFRWDAYRSIERRNTGRQLSHARKKLLLARIARIYFDDGLFFFRRDDLLKKLQFELENLQVQLVSAEELLNELESDHGLLIERAANLYSYSHLSFHEFFTALSYAGENEVVGLAKLAIRDPKYREVFLMAMEKMYDPNETANAVFNFIRREFIQKDIYDAYVDRLVRDIARTGAPLHRHIRERFFALVVDMEVLQLSGSDEVIEEDRGAERNHDLRNFLSSRRSRR